jgi:hypothetical protein
VEDQEAAAAAAAAAEAAAVIPGSSITSSSSSSSSSSRGDRTVCSLQPRNLNPKPETRNPVCAGARCVGVGLEVVTAFVRLLDAFHGRGECAEDKQYIALISGVNRG